MHSTRKGQQTSVKAAFHVPNLLTETMSLVGLGLGFFFLCLCVCLLGRRGGGGERGVVWGFFVCVSQLYRPYQKITKSRLPQPPFCYLEQKAHWCLGYRPIELHSRAELLNPMTWNKTCSSLQMFTLRWWKPANHFLLAEGYLEHSINSATSYSRANLQPNI